MNKPSFEDSALVALRCITQAHRVLEDVVTSSESFDYRKAKKGLKDLQKLIRELGREEARLRAGLVYNATASAQVVPFPTGQRETVNPR
jgi:hypothetical protein